MRRFGKAVAALAVAACTLFGGVATANAADVTYKDNPITLSNVRVSDVGAHTANVSFDYSIDPAQVSQIKDVCFSIEVQRITDITPMEQAWTGKDSAWGSPLYSIDCNGVSDDELTAGSYDAIYGVHNDKEYKGVERSAPMPDKPGWTYYWGDMNATFAKASGQWFHRYYKGWDGKASDSLDFPLIGLTPGTAYTNNAKESIEGFEVPFQYAVQVKSNELLPEGVQAKTPVDIRQVVLYAQPIYKDPNIKVDNNTLVIQPDQSIAGTNPALKFVPDFTTKAEPTATPAEALPSKTDTKLDVANGHAEPGQTARVYVDNLKAEAKAKADANSLFWYAYIYSEPQALTGPGGSPFVQVQKEASTGKYYFDAVIPADLPAGEHKISVQDENGTVQAWTPVTVGDAPAPAPVDKSKLTAAVDAAGKLAEKDYTADSWTPFAKALADAKAVAAKQDASQADVDAAVKALADAQAGLKKAETVPSKPVEPSKPDNGGNNKPSNNNKPANDKPAADDKKSESKNDEQSDLAKTGASVIGVAGILVLLVVLAAGLLVAGKARR